ncbi:MAG TPA: DUF4336 domain-containing protein [Polyangia bacterium]
MTNSPNLIASPSSSEALVALADGVWTARAPIGFLGLRLTTTMTVLRLAGGDLLLCSPVPLTPERRAAVEALGRVAHLYAPNLFHHLWLGDWAAAFPKARVHAPDGLPKKRPELRIDRLHGAEAAPEPAFAGVLDELPIAGFRLKETTLLHRPSGTLVVTDLVSNVGRPAHGWTATYARAMGFHDRIALSRAIRWTGFDDKKAARASLGAILDRSFDRLALGHGEPVLAGGRDALAAAYGWLLKR